MDHQENERQNVKAALALVAIVGAVFTWAYFTSTKSEDDLYEAQLRQAMHGRELSDEAVENIRDRGRVRRPVPE